MPTEAFKQRELTKMKRMASALFLFATVVYIVASIFEESAMWVGFVSATAEAAMVGAIADWFAVTALFRHPAGLKIPHTAIIPRRKDAIAEQFGRFVQHNFLSEEVISQKLSSMNLSQRVAEWLEQPENSALVAQQLAVGIAGVVQVIKDEDIQEMIEHSLQSRIRSTQVTPLLGNLLSLITSGERKQSVLNGAVQLGIYLLEENKDVVQKKITEETPWWFPEPVDKAIYNKIVAATEGTLLEMKTNPDHPLRARFDELVDRFLDDMKHSPDMLAKEEVFKEELLQDPLVHEFTSSLWSDIKGSLLTHSENPNTEFRQAIQTGVTQFGQTVLKEKGLSDKIDGWIEDSARYLINVYGHEVAGLISQTIKNWDPNSTADRIELQIGKDLQFIRINGTVVGGLAGLVIHTVTFFF